jgi:hypothetical protein
MVLILNWEEASSCVVREVGAMNMTWRGCGMQSAERGQLPEEKNFPVCHAGDPSQIRVSTVMKI